MSLCCIETGRIPNYGEPLKAGTRSDVKFFSALSKEAVDRIPPAERRPQPCDPAQGGADIHNATSTENRLFGSYNVFSGFTLLDFVFSVSQETLEKYLPNLARQLKVTK